MKEIINQIWISDSISDEAKNTIHTVIQGLDMGTFSICEKIADKWVINQWLKKAILLYFKISNSSIIANGFFDKIPLKFSNWTHKDFQDAKVRVVPGAIVRYGVSIGSDTVIMPAFINIGAKIGCNSMIDSNSTIGSCATIGNGVHIGANSVLGGVLEPLEENPVIIEDNVFMGANSSVTSGVLISKGAVLASGLHISSSTKIYDVVNNEISYGIIPPEAVVIPGTIEKNNLCSLNAAIIVKYLDSKTRAKVALNEILHVI